MKEIIERIESIGILPVVKIEELDDAVLLAKALIAGGIPAAEITFRTDKAAQAIKRMREAFPKMLVGAGTVLSIDQVNLAIEAGAEFIVSPGFNPEVVKYCVERDIPIFPGVSSAAEIEAVMALGIRNVKFFPAEASGGLKAIQALSGPYQGIRFMPTGGINADNLKSYLQSDKIIGCGGTWMVSDSLLQRKSFDEVETISREAILTMLDFKIKTIEMCDEGKSNSKNVKFLELIQRNNDTNISLVGNKMTVVKVSVSNLKRASHFLMNQGYDVVSNESNLELIFDENIKVVIQ